MFFVPTCRQNYMNMTTNSQIRKIHTCIGSSYESYGIVTCHRQPMHADATPVWLNKFVSNDLPRTPLRIKLHVLQIIPQETTSWPHEKNS